VKSKLENMYGAKLIIDGSTGDIEIKFDPQIVDRVSVERLKSMLIAIGHGFSPARAMRLGDDDTYLESIDLHELVGEAPRDLERIKGRIIGERGKAWKTVEQLTGALLSVQGRYVAIIGGPEGLEAAKSAVRMFAEGKQHKTVYGYLENFRKELKRSQMEIWETGLPPGGSPAKEGEQEGE
jgi:ribosomal RNA assembly protein